LVRTDPSGVVFEPRESYLSLRAGVTSRNVTRPPLARQTVPEQALAGGRGQGRCVYVGQTGQRDTGQFGTIADKRGSGEIAGELRTRVGFEAPLAPGLVSELEDVGGGVGYRRVNVDVRVIYIKVRIGDGNARLVGQRDRVADGEVDRPGVSSLCYGYVRSPGGI
jgi:hypothetical protein